ncbi:hypothetical protein [Ekhidna sp.]|uniref:hypothetical protein n=1 Tax=Ekhidna sp. TaxID=2608089 RepID=UPI003B513CC2
MKAKISYQPLDLSAPYAYAAVMDIELKDEGVLIQLEVEYVGRDSMSIQALKDLGFTENDDYSWKGIIDENWKEDILSFFEMKLALDSDNEIYLHISRDTISGFPVEINRADALFHELLQAILEKDNLEAPLEISLQKNGTKYLLKWVFSERTFSAQNDDSNPESLEWETGRELMKTIYSIDFETQNPLKKAKGDCFSSDGDLWYPLSKSVVKKLNQLL